MAMGNDICAVTGAGGLIGSALCRELLSRDIAVRALLAPGEPDVNLADLPVIEIRRGDIREEVVARSLLDGAATCIHAAALNRLWHRPHRDFYDINVAGTENVCRAARSAGLSRLVFISSCEVYGPALASGAADEGRAVDLRRVRGHYERSKCAAEGVVQAHAAGGLPTVVIRPTAVMGPGDIHRTPPGRLIRAYLNMEIPAYYDAGINVVDVRDAAATIVAALASGREGEAYIVGGKNLRLSELFGLFERACGTPAPPRRVGYRVALAVALGAWLRSIATRADPGITVSGIRTLKHPWYFDNTKARRELGLAPRPIAETVRDAIAWHQEKSSC